MLNVVEWDGARPTEFSCSTGFTSLKGERTHQAVTQHSMSKKKGAILIDVPSNYQKII